MTDIELILWALAVTFGVGVVAWAVLRLAELVIGEVEYQINKRRRERMR